MRRDGRVKFWSRGFAYGASALLCQLTTVFPHLGLRCSSQEVVVSGPWPELSSVLFLIMLRSPEGQSSRSSGSGAAGDRKSAVSPRSIVNERRAAMVMVRRGNLAGWNVITGEYDAPKFQKIKRYARNLSGAFRIVGASQLSLGAAVMARTGPISWPPGNARDGAQARAARFLRIWSLLPRQRPAILAQFDHSGSSSKSEALG